MTQKHTFLGNFTQMTKLKARLPGPRDLVVIYVGDAAQLKLRLYSILDTSVVPLSRALDVAYASLAASKDTEMMILARRSIRHAQLLFTLVSTVGTFCVHGHFIIRDTHAVSWRDV